MKGSSFIVITSLLSWGSMALVAAPQTYREFRQEQAQSADSVRQDMRQSLQRIKDAADAQGQTLPAAKNDPTQGLVTQDPKALRKKLSALDPRERHEAMAFYQRLKSFRQQQASRPTHDKASAQAELHALHDELQRHVDHLEPGAKPQPTPVPVKTPKPKKGK
jgi:Rps23 Pro-64 3,4-dihydroxylase Tpa1-like proline 4-hydroxylase